MALILIGAVFLASGLVVIVVLRSGGWAWLAGCYDLFCDREWVRQLVQAKGGASSVVFVALQVGQVIFAPIPGDVTGILGGYLFGAFGGVILSTLGLTIGSMLNFFIGRFLGERIVRRMVSCETYEKYNELVQYKGILVIFIFFLVPGFPKDYLCLFLGLTTLPPGVFLAVSTVGRFPGTVALSLQGASIFDKNYMFFGAVSVLCLLFAAGAYLLRDPLYRWMARKSQERVCGPLLEIRPKELPNK